MPNGTIETIVERVAGYSGTIRPVASAAARHLKYPSVLTDDGVALIGHRPWVAPHNYMFRLYPPVDVDVYRRYCQRFSIDVPGSYREFLLQLNGAFCFGISFYGMHDSMFGDMPLTDRTALQCHDLALAANYWMRDFPVPGGVFHFGHRHFFDGENAGYFVQENRRILSVHKKRGIVGEWTNFGEFLSDELSASEKLEEELHGEVGALAAPGSIATNG